MSIKTRFYKKVLNGEKQPHGIFTKMRTVAVNPPVHNALFYGQICESSTGDFYIATDKAGTWVKINA